MHTCFVFQRLVSGNQLSQLGIYCFSSVLQAQDDVSVRKAPLLDMQEKKSSEHPKS
jgi:hypothetical protein